jgi:hypothetical protein
MLSPCKWIFVEYKPLVVKMAIDSTIIDIVKANYELLCDLESLLGLACVLPLMEAMQTLSKYVQTQTTFICDFIFKSRFVNLTSKQCIVN